MATTEHFYAGTGTQTSFPFEFPYLTESDVFVKLYNSSTGNFDLQQQNTSGQNNDYSISNTNIVFNTAPPQIAGVNNIHIYRNTDVETAKAVYGTGSAIRAQDLNENTNQSLYKLQEGAQLINTDDIKDEAINSAKIKDETIVNADVSPNAEIAVNKLADGSARQLLETDTTGTGVQWASNIQIPGTLDIIGNTTAHSNLTVSNNLNVAGTSTVTQAATFGNTVAINNQTTINAHLDVNGSASIDDIQIGSAADNLITTASGNLELDSASGTTRVDDDLVVTGSITAPTWNGNHIDTFWLTNKQHINHIGETITLGKASTNNNVSNASHTFSVAKAYTFEVGRRVNEGVNLGTLSTVGYTPCFQVEHVLNQARITKMGSSYSIYNGDEAGYINLGTATASWIGTNTNLPHTNIRHNHLVLSARRGLNTGAITDTNNYAPCVVINGRRGAMFTHPDNTAFSYSQGGNIYSGLDALAKGSYSQGVYFAGDPAGFGNNGYADASEALALFEPAVDFQIIVGGARAKNRFEIGSSSVAGTLSLSGTDVTSTANEINILDGVTSNTSELNKLDGFTGTTTDLNEVVTGKNVVEEITGSATDAQLPTAQAVNERIVELVTEVGGFHPIADEVSFPTTNPDINDGAGTIISIANAAGLKVADGSGSGTYAGTAGNSIGATTTAGTAVTITGIDSSLHGTTIAGKGMLVETTSTLNEYTYHRLVVDEAGIANADALVSAFNERYYGPYAANQATRPSGANRQNGDLYFNTSDGKMKVFNGSHATGTWDDVAAPGNFFINTLSLSSGSGGNSATFNDTATRFTLSNPPLTAQQLLVSVNGVIQKPNSGTSPSEGFAIDGADIIFASAPATGAPYFIVTIGSSVNIGTPSNNTVGADQIIDGSISNAEISSSAAIAKSKLASLDIVDADVNASAAIAKSKIETFVNTNADNRVITGSGTANTLNGEAGLTFNNSILSNAGSGYKEISISASTNNSSTLRLQNSSANFTISNITGGTFSVADGGTSRLAIDSTGNVGIGTSSPSAILHINSSNNNLALLESTDPFASMYMADTNGSVGFVTTLGKLEFRTGGDASTAGTNATAKMIITSDGKVGIGTTSPINIIHATGSTTNAGYQFINTHSTDGYGVYISGGGTSSGRYALRVDDAAGNERFRILSDGNVGIGTSSPSGPLHVYKSSGTSRSYYESGDSHTFIRLLGGSASHNSGLEFYSGSSTNTANITATSSSALQFDVGSVNGAMYINSSGHVGINCTPSRHLHVNSGTSDIVAVFESTDTSAQIQIKDSTGTCSIECLNDFRFVNSTHELLRIKSDKDVQIMDGNLVVASGHGIEFTGTGTGTSTLLDDYEEGTWTPALAASSTNYTTTPTLTVSNARYTKIGRQVFCEAYIAFSSNGAGSSGYQILSGLPYTVNSAQTYSGVYFGWHDINDALLNEHETLAGYVQNGNTYLVFYKSNSNGNNNTIDAPTMTHGVSGNFQINFHYTVA